MSLPEFAKWAQMIISGFSGLVLIMFWFHVQKLERKGRDRGFLFLGAGLIVWAILYLLELTFPVGGGADGEPAMFDRFLRRILSVTNSCLFLLTLPFFDHGFQRLHQRSRAFHHPGKWRNIVLPLAAFTLVLTFLTYRVFDAPDQEWIAGLPEAIFSLAAILTLGYAMLVSFSKRKVVSLSLLTALVLLSLFLVQVLDLLKAAQVTSGDQFAETFLLLRMCSHTLLAMLFFALAFTWVIERLHPETSHSPVLKGEEEARSPRVEDHKGRKLDLGRSPQGKYYIRITWPEKLVSEQVVYLSEGKFKYLLLSAVRKVKGEFVHGENDVRFLYGGNIDTSNSAIKDALNKAFPEAGKIEDRGELFESKGQGKRQYRFAFAAKEISPQLAELSRDPVLKEILAEL